MNQFRGIYREELHPALRACSGLSRDNVRIHRAAVRGGFLLQLVFPDQIHSAARALDRKGGGHGRVHGTEIGPLRFPAEILDDEGLAALGTSARQRQLKLAMVGASEGEEA